MIRTYKQIVPGLVAIWLLVSCTVPGNAGVTALPSPQSNETSTTISVTPQPTSTLPVSEPTPTSSSGPVAPEAVPTHAGTFDNSEQISDGRLKLSIKNFAEKCYRPGDHISLILAYENLTTAPLTIVDYDAVDTHVLWRTQGQLFPVLINDSGDQILTPHDLMLLEALNPNSPLLHKLPAKSVFEVPIDYPFPTEILERGQEPSQAKPTPPGQYLLKFIYISNPQDGSFWDGTISSNQIEICIVT